MRVKLPFSFFIGALWLLVSLAGLFSAAQTASAGVTGWGGVTGEIDLPPAAPAGLAIAGPGAGSVDVPYEFTATLGAGNTPVAYTWEATDHSPVTQPGGGLSDTISFTWRTAGTKMISVTADDGQGTVMATYEVVIDHIPLDIMTVFDVSGSMDFETGCFGCWEPNNADVIQHPWPNNGTHWPLPVDVTTSALCSQPVTLLEDNGIQYLVHEAELYSQISPPEGWRLDQRQVGQGFWVLQRAARTWGNNQLTGASIAVPNIADPQRGAYMRAHPLTVYSQEDVDLDPQLQGAAYDDACFDGPNLSGNCWADRVAQLQAAGVNTSPPSHSPPRLDYDFTPKWSGDTHIWIRAQGGSSYADAWEGPAPNQLPASVKRQMPDYREAIFWQVARADGSSPTDVAGGTYNNLNVTNDLRAPEGSKWRWVKLGSVSTTQNVQYTLRLYQGSAGFNLDKIIFTNYSGGNNGTAIDSSGNVYSGSVATDFRNLVTQNGGKGPNATDGSATREACNVCNPAFGQTVNSSQCSCKKSSTDTVVSGPYEAGGSGAFCTTVLTTTNQLTNDLFHDIDPLRSAKEAVKDLAARLDPKFDQIGFVAFSNNVLNNADGREKLQCKRYYTQNDPANGELKCYDPTTSPISFTHVIRAIETHTNLAATNIGQGILEGLEELGLQVDGSGYVNSNCSSVDNDGRVCDRRGAAHRVLILLTDGAPNYATGCHSNALQNLWQGTVGAGSNPYDCAIYYARAAAQNNVSVYTIGMGPGINSDLLAAMATGTDPTTGHFYFEPVCGQFFSATSPAELEEAITQILALARSCPPNLFLAKSGPASVIAGDLITYTLTISNSGPAPAHNLVITDALPGNASYVSGGSLVGQVVSWTIPSLAANGGMTQTQFVVTASQMITNSDYAVVADGGYGAAGGKAAVTLVQPVEEEDQEKRFLPISLKQ